MYLLIFAMPKGATALNVKINRSLKDIDAEKVQNSVWRSDNLKELTKIAVWVRDVGGSAHVLEEKIIY